MEMNGLSLPCFATGVVKEHTHKWITSISSCCVATFPFNIVVMRLLYMNERRRQRAQAG